MKAFVLLTAMPPTTGHLHLLQFANNFAPDGVVAVIMTQPHEPFVKERVQSLKQAIGRTGMTKRVKLIHYYKTIEQDSSTPGYWEVWRKMMEDFGLSKEDCVIASERYGKKLAEVTNTRFFPYDIARAITPVKAANIRSNPIEHFDDIIPEFQPYLRTRVTIFGAESTGKTTLSRQLAQELDATWLFEYCRPYLEEVVNEITPNSMTTIWKGQRALQQHSNDIASSPYIIQDTDLFSTVGYWQFPHQQDALGACPPELVEDAVRLQSDLYIITKSNIPFEVDPLRYGGDKREGSDEYWLDVCKRYNLPYVVLDSPDRTERLKEAIEITRKTALKKCSELFFDRHNL